jgi:CDGSH-type Zn-finger protein/uncharacterized Fe-S cluster protein YjdI
MIGKSKFKLKDSAALSKPKTRTSSQRKALRPRQTQRNSMAPTTNTPSIPTREILLHMLYEAAELEHNLMCTYLYAAFSLKDDQDGLQAHEAQAVARWRREVIAVAVDEMSHLVAVWNITSALGGVPRFGRGNFPLDAGYLPAGIVVKLAPFNEAVLQHFIHLERPAESNEAEGEGFAYERYFTRATAGQRLTPTGLDYATVGEFYAAISAGLRALVAAVGDAAVFCGDAALQLTAAEVNLPGATRVVCLKTALASLEAIVVQGEGAPAHAEGSHFDRFCAIRAEYVALTASNPAFVPSHPAATNPVLRRPPRPEGRVWIEAQDAMEVVDLSNSAYGLMLRLLAYAYATPSPHPDKALAIDLGIGLMHAMTTLAEQAARLPAGPANPNCHAGMSFTALRDTAALPIGPAANRYFIERFAELSTVANRLAAGGQARLVSGARLLADLAQRAAKRLDTPRSTPARINSGDVAAIVIKPANANTASTIVDGVEVVEGQSLTLKFDTPRCIHARFCVTGAPTVFLANVVGPWLHPDTLNTERLVAVAHECPSGAISYVRKDGGANEAAPPVNLAAIREAGPYAFRGQLQIDGVDKGYRATLCRCGASQNKPFCDGSHKAAGFTASGEPDTVSADMLSVRDGTLAIDPQTDGPLQVRGNLEITSGTGRVVARLTSAKLCRCGGSATKPFCDGTHARIGFKS